MAAAERGLTTRHVRATRPGRGKYARTPTPYGGLSYTLVASTTWQRSLPFRQPDETATYALSTRRTGDHTTNYLLLNTSHLLRFPFLVRHAYASLTYSRQPTYYWNREWTELHRTIVDLPNHNEYSWKNRLNRLCVQTNLLSRRTLSSTAIVSRKS